MSKIKKAYAVLTEKTEAELLDVKHGKLTSTRLWALVAFVGLIVWLTRGVLTESNIRMLFYAVCVYITGDTITRSITIYVNGRTKRVLADAFMKDGKLDANETSVLTDAARSVKTSSPSP